MLAKADGEAFTHGTSFASRFAPPAELVRCATCCGLLSRPLLPFAVSIKLAELYISYAVANLCTLPDALSGHHTLIFILSYISMVPCANLVGFAGQEFARKVPHVLGVLIETTLVPLISPMNLL